MWPKIVRPRGSGEDDAVQILDDDRFVGGVEWRRAADASNVAGPY
jgi:hypothetical protein